MKMPFFLTAAAMLSSATPASAQDQNLEISGYVKPSIATKYRPEAVPADRFQVGFNEAKAGLRMRGYSGEAFDYNVYLYLTGDALDVLTRAIPLDTDNDGDADKIYTKSAEAAKNLLREAWVNWRPTQGVNLKMGRMAIPFTSQAQAPDTELMFPNRASPNAVFLQERDLGALAQFSAAEGRVELQGGVYNGTGEALGSVSQTGVLYALRFDLAPLGAFNRSETGKTEDSWRFGWGAGVAIRPYTLYDSSGYPSTGVTDIRGTTSFRLTGRGIHFLAEALGRYTTDTLTDRPLIDFGAFGQLGWYIPSGVEPVVRVGWVTEDYSFSPQQIYWGEAGMNFYLHDPLQNAKPVRIGIHYTNEYRYTEREIAHGASAQLLVYF